MKRKILVIVLPLLYLLIACTNESGNNQNNKTSSVSTSEFRTFTPRDSSYVVSYPKTWDARRGRKSFQLMLISQPTDSTDKFRENVIVFREDAQGKNLEGYVKYIAEEKLPYEMKDFKVVSQKPTTINGEKAIRMEYTFSYRKPARAVGYVFEKEGFAYIVLGTAYDSTFAQYVKTFDAVARSFKFTNK
jgi:hypothetical protein